MNLKQIEYKVLIELESGLHIGGGDSTIEIGGVDNKVIRDMVSNEPYIPGSSLKGKMRSLLDDFYHGDKEKEKLVNIMFGIGGEHKKEEKEKQTRLQFVDLFMNQETKDTLNNSLGNNIYTVVKYENTIDKKTGKAKNPRPTERVPKGSIFEGKVVLNVLEHLADKKEEFEEVLFKGFELLNRSYLGGSGSRGYGKIKTNIQEV